MRVARKVCVSALMFILLITFSGCISKKVDKLLSEVEVVTDTVKPTPGPPEGQGELVWDEEAMFGLKFPSGEIVFHNVVGGAHFYTVEGLPYDQFKACIKEIKDLGFTQSVKEDEYMYEGYHVKCVTRFIKIRYFEGGTGYTSVDIVAGQ